MMKSFLRKTISAVVVGATITILVPLGVSAQWKKAADNTWKYTEGNQLAKGWRNISGGWYYFYSDGTMNTDWIQYKGYWYYSNDSGVMQTDWVKVDGTWYYFDNTGAMQTGWINDNGNWYYADSTGKMKTGILNIAGKTYYFNNSGVMQTGSSAQGETVEISGLATLPHNYYINIQSDAENQILELMNQKRTEAGLQPLTMDNTLLQVARYKSDHMIQYNYFDHITPDGIKWTSWLKAIGYQYTTTGENIAYNTYDGVELFNQWWNSEGHRANMMNSSYTKVGIGVINGNGKYMGTQTFSN